MHPPGHDAETTTAVGGDGVHRVRIRRPSIPTAAVAIAAFFAMVVLPRATVPLVDGDVWWHLRAGEQVLRTGRVPVTDTWSIAGLGMTWTSQDWLANSGMAAIGGISSTWGPTLLSITFGMVAVAAFALLWSAMGRRIQSPGWLSRLLWLTAGLVVAGPIVGVRVQTLDLLLAAAAVWVLWNYLADPRTRWLLALPLLAVVWVNLHAGYPLLFLLGGAVVIGEAVDRLLARVADTPPIEWGAIGRLTVGLLAAFLALSANPNGLAIYAYPFETASIGAHRDFIFEWSRPDLSSFPGQVLFVFVLAAVVPTLWLGRDRMRTADALWLIGLTAMSLFAIRFVLFIGPIGAALAAVHLTPALIKRGWLPRGGIWTRMGEPREGRWRPGVNAALIAIVGIAGAGLALSRSAPGIQQAAIAEAMPVEAAAWLRAHPPAERIFNVYSWGGYLGRELPGALVYIDGRSDIYGDAPIREYADVIALRANPASLLDRAQIDTIVFWPVGPFADWLDREGSWSRGFEDERAAVWVRRNAE